ncbi:MAG: aspartate carbamoyltransferase [Candidatus Heimdallarchaeota archaeon]
MNSTLQGRDLISVKDLRLEEMKAIFDLAKMIQTAPQKYSEALRGKIVAVAFYEPSTRTRLSFESAVKRMGGNTLGFSDPRTASVAKGECLADSIRMLDGYSDLIILRHYLEGAARFASEVAEVPVINGGSGAGEHPTQALLDMYTILLEKGTLDGLRIAFVGDLRYGRTVHSLAYALANFDMTFDFVAPPELRMRREILDDLEQKNISFSETTDLEKVLPELDVCYMTRIQKERFPDPADYEKVRGSYQITRALLKSVKEGMLVMHPLPRVNEIAFEVDELPNAVYFRQARNGVFVRMSLLVHILGE